MRTATPFPIDGMIPAAEWLDWTGPEGDHFAPWGSNHYRRDGMSESVDKAIKAIDDAGGLVTPREIARDWRVREATISDRIAGRVRLYLLDQVEPYRR